MKFIVDSTLGKLAKWLRILGYDTLFTRCNAKDMGQAGALTGDRVLLTRQVKGLPEPYPGEVFVVTRVRLSDQIDEVIGTLNLAPSPDRMFTRCVRCNAELLIAERKEVESDIPAFVAESFMYFRKCPNCGRIYWPGTHRDRMLSFIRNRSRAYRP